MDKSLQTLCSTLKNIIEELKPHTRPLSFLLMTGRMKQGKTALLRQSRLNYYTVPVNNTAHFFYNDQGIILELGESWLQQSEDLLSYTLKQLNRCHRSVKISGILLCIDSGEMLLTEPSQLGAQCKLHTQLLARFGYALGYRVDAAIIFTKLDLLAGFGEFFQSEHNSDLVKPLGFSLASFAERHKLLTHYQLQFDHMIETMGQRIINKLHTARSTIKRTLIREFPLQLAGLRLPVQRVIQSIPTFCFHLQAVYFTSAEQGGHSLDRLNRKIQHEYALMSQDHLPQSNNYQSYFIFGAIHAFQEQTKRYVPRVPMPQKLMMGGMVLMACLLLAGLGYRYINTSSLLDEVSQELFAYETQMNQSNNRTSAFYHLSLAEKKLAQIRTHLLPMHLIKRLKTRLYTNTQHKLHDGFLPEMVTLLEKEIVNPSQTVLARFSALKIYVMLGESKHYVKSEVMRWFEEYWQSDGTLNAHDKQRMLLENALKQPWQPLRINQQLVIDTRNYLNALPATYLYYPLAKKHFPSQKTAITIKGFDLASDVLPVYFTKRGFKQIIKSLPALTKQLRQEDWVLLRHDLDTLQSQLEQAYCLDYISWWNHFIRRTQPLRYQNYQQARERIQTLQQTEAISHLVDFMQQQTSPEEAKDAALFNRTIGRQFAALNLMSTSALQELKQNIKELEKFLTTVALIDDHEQAVFDLTKARFQGENASDPLSSLYNKSRALPEPIATWAKQIADDTWSLFINESRRYLNKQWQNQVFQIYETTIAHRYPVDALQKEEVALADFDRFFAPNGILNQFTMIYLKPFLDTSRPEWRPKELNGYVLPIASELVNELIRANVISNMFFSEQAGNSKIDFSLQKISLDPVVANLQLTIGPTILIDSQNSDSFTSFTWPGVGAKLALHSIDGQDFVLEETGVWAFFKMLQKVNVLVDSNDSASLQILFEVNGNSGRYLLKTANQINPFSPGILTGFSLNKEVA